MTVPAAGVVAAKALIEIKEAAIAAIIKVIMHRRILVIIPFHLIAE